MTQDITKHELQNCNFVKTLLMLLVVLDHSVAFWSGGWFTQNPIFESALFRIATAFLGDFHTYGFVLVSGYLFFYLKYEKSKYQKFLPFVANKAKRLLIPYAFVSLVWVIPFTVYFFRDSVLDIVKSFVFGTSPAQLWFLLMLYGVFCVFQVLSNFFEKNNILGFGVVILFYGISIVGPMVLPNIFQIFRMCSYIPIFWLGFKIRQYGIKWLLKIPSLIWILADVSIFVFIEYISRFNGIFFTLLRLGGDFVLHIVGALMAFIVLQKIAERVNWQKSKAFGFLSKNSMTVYLFHQQVIYVLISLLNGRINPYIHATINFVGAMVIALLLSKILMKSKITRFLIGEK